MIKFTLYCENGRLFQTACHYLLLGDWITWCEGYTILQHGILSDQEEQQIFSQELVNVYQDMRNKSIGITSPYHEKYMQRNNNPDNLTLYAGCLKRNTNYLWKGSVTIK